MTVSELIEGLQMIAKDRPDAPAWLEYKGRADLVAGIEWRGAPGEDASQGFVVIMTGED